MVKDNYPENRHFGKYGGRYVPEMLIPALDELEKAYFKLKEDKDFLEKLNELRSKFSGRSTPLYFAKNMTSDLNGCKIYLKREDLNHTGSHKINNVLGQILLAKALGKKEIIAETGAGQHGLATATACAMFGMKCKVFMGETDIKRQFPNVYSMKLLGAEVIPVSFGTRTLKDAVNAALKYWIEHLDSTHYLLGSALGPYPYPVIVRDFQSIIGIETRAQIKVVEGRNPDKLIACVGGGSNSIGLFYPFLDDDNIEMIGVEAGGTGFEVGQHAARFHSNPTVGIVQGYKSYFLQDEYGQLCDTHSISAGLDYAGVGPQLADLYDSGRIKFESVNDEEVLKAFKYLCTTEGIIPALESSHAVAYALKTAGKMKKDQIMVINISGRGDKDIFITAPQFDPDNWKSFLINEVAHEE